MTHVHTGISTITLSFTIIMSIPFDEQPILRFLGLPVDGTYAPSPATQPLEFLKQNIHILPPHLLIKFSSITSPKQRVTLPIIRNRRLRYTETNPQEFDFSSARNTWPMLWEGRERRGAEEGKAEKDWVKDDFLAGLSKHVGKLGALLGGYEEEREAERVRTLRREAAAEEPFVPEEDDESDSDDDNGMEQVTENLANLETDQDARLLFERRIRERFIYGLLEVNSIILVNLKHADSLYFPRTLTMTKWTGTNPSTKTTTETLKSGGSTTKKRTEMYSTGCNCTHLYTMYFALDT